MCICLIHDQLASAAVVPGWQVSASVVSSDGPQPFVYTLPPVRSGMTRGRSLRPRRAQGPARRDPTRPIPSGSWCTIPTPEVNPGSRGRRNGHYIGRGGSGTRTAKRDLLASYATKQEKALGVSIAGWTGSRTSCPRCGTIGHVAPVASAKPMPWR